MKLAIAAMILVMGTAYVALLLVPRGRWALKGVLHISIVLGLVVELGGSVLTAHGINNSFLYNTSILLDFLLVLVMVYRVRPAWRNQLLATAVLGSIGMLLGFMIKGDLNFILIEGALLISLLTNIALLASLWIMANTSERKLAQRPDFWLFMGLLFYFGGMMPIIAMIRFIFDQNAAAASRLWLILPLLCMLRYILTAYACRVATRENRP